VKKQIKNYQQFKKLTAEWVEPVTGTRKASQINRERVEFYWRLGTGQLGIYAEENGKKYYLILLEDHIDELGNIKRHMHWKTFSLEFLGVS